MAAYPRFKADTKTCFQSKYERRGTEQDRIDACERLRDYGGSLPQYDDAVFQVEERTGYGMRPVEVTRKDCRVLSWSNAAQNWAAYAMREKKGTSTLDSNHIMVCGLGQARANALALALPPLPLYGGSTEARERRRRGRGGVNGL